MVGRAFLVTFLFLWTCVTSTKIPIVIAHRGAAGYRPENTLASYEMGIDFGSDFVEADLMSSKDHALVATHSFELSETTDVASHMEFADRKRTITLGDQIFNGWFPEDFTLSELRTLSNHERFEFRSQSWNGLFHIPTLQEMLQLVRGKEAEQNRTIGVYLETKHSAHFKSVGLPLEDKLLQVLKEFGYENSQNVFLQSFETDNLRYLKNFTAIPLIQLIETENKRQFDTGRLFGDLMTYEGLQEIHEYAAGIGPNKLSVIQMVQDHESTLVNNAHKAGLLVHVYTMRTEEIFWSRPNYTNVEEEIVEYLSKYKVDGVFSDQPDVAIQVVNKLFRPSHTPCDSDSTGTITVVNNNGEGNITVAAIVLGVSIVTVLVVGVFFTAMLITTAKTYSVVQH